MKKKKMSNCIKFIIFIFPVLVILLSVFRTGQYSFSDFENYFAVFRSLDFGLFNFLNLNMLGSISSPVILLMVDFLIYYLYFKLFDLIYSCFGVFIDLIRSFFEKFGGDK